MIILFAVVFFNLLSLPCDRMEVEAEQGMISKSPPFFDIFYEKWLKFSIYIFITFIKTSSKYIYESCNILQRQ